MSPSVGARPCFRFQASAIRGNAASAAICGRLAMPIGPRASSMLISTPNSANVSTNAPIGASDP